MALPIKIDNALIWHIVRSFVGKSRLIMSVMRRLGIRHGALDPVWPAWLPWWNARAGGADWKDRSCDAGANAVTNGGTALGREGSDKTITADNETEFHNYKELKRILGVEIYFATPHLA